MSVSPSELFIAWQDVVGRGIYPVARLRVEVDEGQRLFAFCYVQGALQAEERGFVPFASFPDLKVMYVSRDLFPFFTNRIMQPRRPDFAGYVAELDLSEATAEPLALLGRSGGTRVTDRVEVYAAPQVSADAFVWHFLLRGVRHLPALVEERIARLTRDERLYVMRDAQNPHNPQALLLRSEDKVSLGYIPDLLVDDLARLELQPDNPVVRVVRVNPPPSPVQHRVLCELRARWPAGVVPFTSERFKPLAG